MFLFTEFSVEINEGFENIEALFRSVTIEFISDMSEMPSFIFFSEEQYSLLIFDSGVAIPREREIEFVTLERAN